MADGPTASQWAELRAKRPVSEDALTTRSLKVDGADSAISIGTDSAGHLHLLVPVQAGPAGAPPTDLNGLKVRRRHLESGQLMDLAAHPSHERVFTPVCNEIVEAILVQRREPWAAVAAIIRAWQSAWKPTRPEMEKSVQVGLFGELLVLHTLMIPALGPGAVWQWSGPDAERHDFVGASLDIEVKTTRKSRHEHEISRLDQLRVPKGRRLFVISVLVEESVAGDESIATRMDAITDLLRGDAAALDDFMAKMVTLHWSDEIRRSGELVRFNLRDACVYPVDAEFPRLPDDFAPPSGVVAVKYTVDLVNLPYLDLDEVKEVVRTSGLAK